MTLENLEFLLIAERVDDSLGFQGLAVAVLEKAIADVEGGPLLTIKSASKTFRAYRLKDFREARHFLEYDDILLAFWCKHLEISPCALRERLFKKGGILGTDVCDTIELPITISDQYKKFKSVIDVDPEKGVSLSLFIGCERIDIKDPAYLDDMIAVLQKSKEYVAKLRGKSEYKQIETSKIFAISLEDAADFAKLYHQSRGLNLSFFDDVNPFSSSLSYPASLLVEDKKVLGWQVGGKKAEFTVSVEEYLDGCFDGQF